MSANDILNVTASYPEWDLSALYTHDQDPLIEEDFKTIEKLAREFESLYKGKFISDQEWQSHELLEAVKMYEAITMKQGKLYTYFGLRYYKNALDEKICQNYQSLQERMTELDNYLIFFSLEVNEISDDTLKSAFEKNNALAFYKPYFDNLRTYRPFQKSEEIEKILSDKDLTSRNAWVRLFDETMAELTFEIDGELKSLSHVTQQMGHLDPAKRRSAAVALSKGLQSQSKLFVMITNVLSKDKSIEDKLRGFQSPWHSRNIANQTENEVVDALVQTVIKNYQHISHRYYALKAKLLNMNHLNYWDRNAPLTLVEDKKYSWLEAKEIVLSAYQAFSPVLAEIGQRFFDNHWIDVPITPGKTDGAFAHPATPDTHPFILLNFEGTKRDVMTLAHELGHGIHQVLSYEQGYLMADTPLTLAETASVFGEMLTFQSLLSKATSDAEKQTLLASKIDDILNTVIRQIAFHQFEVRVHTKRQEGELSAQDIAAIWMETQKEALGDAVHLDPLIGNYWSYISHFIHSPFYVYAYAFADCIVNSLFNVYQTTPQGFVDKYVEMLRAGGSKGHKELLAPFGLSAHDPHFWQNGLSLVKSLIDELESLSA